MDGGGKKRKRIRSPRARSGAIQKKKKKGVGGEKRVLAKEPSSRRKKKREDGPLYEGEKKRKKKPPKSRGKRRRIGQKRFFVFAGGKKSRGGRRGETPFGFRKGVKKILKQEGTFKTEREVAPPLLLGENRHFLSDFLPLFRIWLFPLKGGRGNSFDHFNLTERGRVPLRKKRRSKRGSRPYLRKRICLCGEKKV